MHQGLIPVLSRETGVDTDGYGIMLNTCSVDEIVKVVKKLSQYPPEWCEEMSRRTRKAAIEKFSEDTFLENLRKNPGVYY
jgi:glycosyltransferase involved in cell wall biosynthesis